MRLRPVSLVLSLIATVLLSGCGLHYKLDVQQGNLFDAQTVESLEIGMSRRQVLLIMGSPSIISPFETDRWDYISSIRRGRGKMETRALTLHFEGETLMKIEGDYFPEDPQQLIKDASKYKRMYADDKQERPTRPTQDD